MTMPSVDKTYQFSSALTSGTTLYASVQHMMYTLKEALKGFSTNPWVVMGSSDAVTAGMDGVDRWTDYTKVVRAASGTAHSWIVLRQSQVSTSGTFEFCFDYNGADNNAASIVFCINPFSGGSTTARPTSTGERSFHSASRFVQEDSTWGGSRRCLIAMQSTDGHVTRLAFVRSNYISQYLYPNNLIRINNPVGEYFAVERLKNPVSGWSDSHLCCWTTASYTDTDRSNCTALNSKWLTTSSRYRGYGLSTYFSAALAGEGAGTKLLCMYNAENRASGKFPIFPVSAVSTTTGAQGHLGQLFDMWWVPRYGEVNEVVFWPDDSSRKYIQLGDVLLPWDGLNSSPGTIPPIFV